MTDGGVLVPDRVDRRVDDIHLRRRFAVDGMGDADVSEPDANQLEAK